MSAILLTHSADGEIDWASFEAHVARTHNVGLVPAVNMDTGFVQLLDDRTKAEVLRITSEVTAGNFVAGAFVADAPGDSFDLRAYTAEAAAVATHGGTPVIFPSHGLNGGGDQSWIDGYRALGGELDRFVGFELGTMFVPYGHIASLQTYRELLAVPACVGAKHSSLSRELEWQRLAVRDQVRPDFMVLTGNDLAIDMVTYGADYLLGLSTMAPEAFAERDRRWAAGEASFHELNDLLQYLGHFTFRDPVPGYRHNAAMVLELRGWSTSSEVPAGAPRRPDSDRAVLTQIIERIEEVVGG
jgi:dihydrodipicolinate synthase/N-acetylneuraminate lyase